MKNLILILLLCLICLFFSNTKAAVLDKIVAIVGDEIILKSDIENIKGLENKGILDRLIEQKILFNEANQMGISVDERHIEDYIDGIKIENGWNSETEFEKYLKLEGMSLFDLKEQIRLDIITHKLKQRIISNAPMVSKEDIKKYYNTEYSGKKDGEKVLIAHILLDNNKKSINLANTILEEYKSGLSFDDLVKKYSKDSLSKSNGGDLGYLEIDKLLPQFKEAISNLEVGDIVGPISTGAGYHILKLKERKKDGLIPGSDIWNDIQKKLMEEGRLKFYSKWLDNKKATVYIEILDNEYR